MLRNSLILLGVIGCLLVGMVGAQTVIPGGSVSGTWYATGSPYLIEGEITVPGGDSLIIEPGVDVIFQGHYKLIVNGWLLAEGTETDSILFTAADTSVGWHGVRFVVAPDSSKLAFCLIQHGKANGTAPYIDSWGGGVLCNLSNPVINHCTFRNNTAYRGGGLACWEIGANPTITNCIFSENFASNNGGAVYLCPDSLNALKTFSNCVVSDNSSYEGGGITCCGYMTMDLCDITGNFADSNGGGVRCAGLTEGVISNCTISDNVAGGFGGGAYFYESTQTMDQCTILSNIAYKGGGILVAWSGSNNLQNCTIIENQAEHSGGGIHDGSDNGLIENCLIKDNSCTYYAGGLVVDRSMTLLNTTICDNYGGLVGGLFVNNGMDSCIVTNCIVWNNQYPQISVSPGYLEINYSNIEGGYPGTGNIDADPLFVSGPDGEYCLSQLAAGQSEQSPCVDAGDPASPLIDGTTRTDGVPDQGIVDMGYHYPAFSPPPPPPLLTITLTPYNPPIIIPSSGGSFDYNIEGANTQSYMINCDVWCDVLKPNGTYTNPVMGPVNINFPGSASINRDRTQNVPDYAPPGIYQYCAYIGVYPDSVVDSDSFPAEKLASGEGGGWFGDWLNYGEPFEFEGVKNALPIPQSFRLLPPQPNPFNATTTIRFELPEAGWVKLEVFDLAGRRVGSARGRPLREGFMEAGSHQVRFDGSELASGIYFYRLEAGDFAASGKMVLAK